jgi:phosphoribosylformylglycinamidine synthase
MLLVAKPGKEARVLEVCKKWELDAAVIGRVTDSRRWVVKATPGYDPLVDPASKRAPVPVTVCDIPIDELTDEAPVYDRPRAVAKDVATSVSDSAIPVPKEPTELARELLELVGSPNVGSRAWVWRQYDQIVRGGTVMRPGSDAGVVRVPCERDGKTVEKILAFASDCNGRMCELDPYVGGAMAVAEACRNLVCSGAEPIGLTDCLNFGNPEKPEVMDQFARSVDGIAAACNALGVPIVSGNVSLYNETDGKSILPTPTIAAVGLVAAREDIVRAHFARAGEHVWLLGKAASEGARGLAGSEWLVRALGKLTGDPLLIELGAEAKLQKLLLELARAHVLTSAHDVSDGGLAATLAECCTTGLEDVGATIELPARGSAVEALADLFGESPSRVVLSAPASSDAALAAAAQKAGVPLVRIGTTGGAKLATLTITVAPLGALAVETSAIRTRREGCLDAITQTI